MQPPVSTFGDHNPDVAVIDCRKFRASDDPNHGECAVASAKTRVVVADQGSFTCGAKCPHAEGVAHGWWAASSAAA